MLASTGIRVGELVKLNRSDVDFENRECVVLGKGNKQRIIYLNEACRTTLADHLQERLSEKHKACMSHALFISKLLT